MRRPVYVVDSFTERPFAGNPAGVVLDGADLDAAQMQRIAGEMRHSETAFPLPTRDSEAQLHLRWFTPELEVAFCGHATLAAFHVLAAETGRLPAPSRVAFTCKSGLLHAELSHDDRGRLSVLIETPDSRFEPALIKADLLAALGLVPEVLDPRIAPRRSAILEGYLYLALRDREALARCSPDADALVRLGEAMGVAGFVVYALEPRPGIDAALRCFFPGCGILEDPVTGSAAGQLGALIQSELPKDLPRRLVFTQGDEMGRPGRVLVEIRSDAGRPRGWIGGEAAVVVRGELSL